jgi:DNA-binding transcriptional ArsR family regulator
MRSEDLPMSVTSTVGVIEDTLQAATALEPTRLRLLAALAAPDSAAGLARRFHEPRQQINYHLRRLESAGLITLVEERPQRGFVERIMQATASAYVVSPATLGELAADLRDVGDRFSAGYLLALAGRVIRDVASLVQRATAAGKRLATFSLETQVRFASPAAQHAFADELTRAVAALVAKYHDGVVSDGRSFRFVIGGYPVTPPATTSTTAVSPSARSRATHPAPVRP